MIEQWLGTSGTEAVLVAVSGVAILLWVIATVRVVGLRSFAKMSSFDYAVTIASGSIIATTAASSASLVHGMLAITTLFGVQWVIAKLRGRSVAHHLFDNRPILLMNGRQFCDENLSHARITRQDVLARLRESNITSLDEVLAVVLETTGDVSVLHGTGPVDLELIDGVRDGHLVISPSP